MQKQGYYVLEYSFPSYIIQRKCQAGNNVNMMHVTLKSALPSQNTNYIGRSDDRYCLTTEVLKITEGHVTYPKILTLRLKIGSTDDQLVL